MPNGNALLAIQYKKLRILCLNSNNNICERELKILANISIKNDEDQIVRFSANNY
jgi:hypothetical protein